MTMPASMQWLLTIMFAVIAAYCLARCAYTLQHGMRHPVSAWTTELAHLTMSLAMLSMIWAAVGDQWQLQLTLFAVLAGWFAVRALVGPPPAIVSAGPVAAVTRPALTYEAVNATAMVWMLWPDTGMAGMHDHSVARTGGSPTITLALVLALAVGAAGWAWSCRRTATRAFRTGPARQPRTARLFGPIGEAACQTVMASAMALALVASV